MHSSSKAICHCPARMLHKMKQPHQRRRRAQRAMMMLHPLHQPQRTATPCSLAFTGVYGLLYHVAASISATIHAPQPQVVCAHHRLQHRHCVGHGQQNNYANVAEGCCLPHSHNGFVYTRHMGVVGKGRTTVGCIMCLKHIKLQYGYGGQITTFMHSLTSQSELHPMWQCWTRALCCLLQPMHLQ